MVSSGLKSIKLSILLPGSCILMPLSFKPETIAKPSECIKNALPLLGIPSSFSQMQTSNPLLCNKIPIVIPLIPPPIITIFISWKLFFEFDPLPH